MPTTAAHADDAVEKERPPDRMADMAAVVDEQNAGDPDYRRMPLSFLGHAFLAGRDLVFGGVAAPSGYTEPTLHGRRLQRKSAKTGVTT